MRHDLRLEGDTFALRPIGLQDAEFIVEVRAGDAQRTRFLHPVTPDVEAQRQWLTAYFDRDDDYYWVIERRHGNTREGLVGLYDQHPATLSAEWGRWVLRPGSLAAPESALLVYRAAFERLGLEAVCCITLAQNLPVLSFHDSCGLQRVATLKDHITLDGQTHDAVKHLCTEADWPGVRRRLEPQAQLIARRLNR